MKISLNPIKFWKDQASSLSGNVSKSVGSVRSSYSKVFEVIKARKAEPGIENMSFNQMLMSWGVSKDEIPTVIKGMNTERYVISTVAAIYSIPAIMTGLSLWGTAGIILLCSVAMAVWMTRTWRINCLEKEKFTPFRQWMGF